MAHRKVQKTVGKTRTEDGNVGQDEVKGAGQIPNVDKMKQGLV